MHAEVWSEPDMQKVATAVRSIYTPDFVRHGWMGDQTLGFDGVVQDVRFGRDAFPDLKEQIDNSGTAIVAEGDFVVNLFHTTGTQARDLGRIPHYFPRIPSRGKRMNMAEMEMFRIVNGKIAEQWVLPDIWGANIQLGLFDPDHWTESVCDNQQASSNDGK